MARIILASLASVLLVLIVLGRVQEGRIEQLEARFSQACEGSSTAARNKLRADVEAQGGVLLVTREGTEITFKANPTQTRSLVNRVLAAATPWSLWQGKVSPTGETSTRIKLKNL